MDAPFNGYLPHQPYSHHQHSNQQQAQSQPQQHSTQQSHQQHHSQHQPHQQSQQGLASFSSLQNQHHQHPDSQHTLPPLQNHNGYSQFGSLSFAGPGNQSHTPSTPHAPSTSATHQPSSSYSHSPGNMLPPSSFGQSYNMSQSMMYPSSTSTSLPSAQAQVGLPNIRPMPPGGVGSSVNGLPSLTHPGHMGQQATMMQSEEPPTHVVGSQGRRGILPSAPGRPEAPHQNSGLTAKTMVPQKDASGKYPCAHCTKTYLHAKHLKRHMLRHTGDRPYQCFLCKDTFSRSDILKRHFQKCSARRGNPTGASHLAHQQRRSNGGNRQSISQQDGPVGLAGLAEVASTPYNSTNVANHSPTVTGDMSGRSSRANSLISPGNMSHRNSLAGLGILGSNNASAEHMASSAGYQAGMPAYSMQPHQHQHPAGYSFPAPSMNGQGYSNGQQQQQQPMSFLGQTSSRFNHNPSNSPHQQQGGNSMNNGNQVDWSRMFNAGGQDGFVGGQPANASSGVNDVKSSPTDEKPNYQHEMQHDIGGESFLGSLYSHPGALGGGYSDHEHGILGFPNWSMNDPLQAKVDSLMQFCFPHGPESMHGDEAAEIVKACLTVDNVKHFAEHYTSYQGHWPILHMPTFKLTDANNGLVLAMICIGAVYSPKLDARQVRRMMEFVQSTVSNNSSIYAATMDGQTEGLGTRPWEVEELQALLMLQILHTWHGEPQQRRAARDAFPTLGRIAKAMGLCQTVGQGHYAFSILHLGRSLRQPLVDQSGFNWHNWLEQEKRNRVLYLVYMLDAAMVMFFNTQPQFDPLEVRLTLPADDAAWEARDQTECANALGLNGAKAQDCNMTGTRAPRQPEMREALRCLLEPTLSFEPGSTNAYSKFVLIHAMIVRIIACQKTLVKAESSPVNFNFSLGGSGPATPLSQNDWLDHNGHSTTHSGRGTPVDGANIQMNSAQQDKKRLTMALDKWKRAWDADLDQQFPPGRAHLRRFGFSRDGVHFFFLGQSLLQSNRPSDWDSPADTRFKQVMGTLKQIKVSVTGDNHAKGHDAGSVGDIDDHYGTDVLTFDMKLLFRPYDSSIHSPVVGVRTNAL